jgi:hypothetical protein
MPSTTTTAATARQQLADTTAQASLISQQLAAVTEALHGAEVGTDQHVALAGRAMQLSLAKRTSLRWGFLSVPSANGTHRRIPRKHLPTSVGVSP